MGRSCEDGVRDITVLCLASHSFHSFFESSERYNMSESPIFDQVYREYAENGKHYERMITPIMTRPVSFCNMGTEPVSEEEPTVMPGQLTIDLEPDWDMVDVTVSKPCTVKTLAEMGSEGDRQE